MLFNNFMIAQTFCRINRTKFSAENWANIMLNSISWQINHIMTCYTDTCVTLQTWPNERDEERAGSAGEAMRI